MSKYDENKQLRCSFCGKPQSQVARLVAGPGVYICDECIAICQDILKEGVDADGVSHVFTIYGVTGWSGGNDPE